MSKSARRLGRGLDSLVSPIRSSLQHQAANVASADLSADNRSELKPRESPSTLPIDSLRPNPFQPRDNISDESILSLADSIRKSGMLQPVAVRSVSGRYEIIAGERRWRAARSVGLSEIPVIVHEATDEKMLELALVENIQREDLNAIQRARAYREFCTRFALKPPDVASRLGEDRTTVLNYLRLLDLPESVQSFVAGGKLSMGHARCILGLSKELDRERLADSAVANQLSVRALEEIVRRTRTRDDAVSVGQPQRSDARLAHLRDVERRFEEAVKTKVRIQEGRRKGAGRIVIEYYSLADFDRIAARLGVTLE